MEKLYTELAEWWSLLSPPESYAQEALAYHEMLCHVSPSIQNILELGCGGGHLAHNMPDHLQITLCDLSPQMLSISQGINPQHQHICADMRTLRLNQLFDAVLIHNAVMYLTTEQELLKTLLTASAHLRPGGALLVMPDLIQESFVEHTHCGGNDDPHQPRGIRLMEWRWDPDPNDTTIQAEFSFLIREGTSIRSIHESHTMGIFSMQTWVELLHQAQFKLIPPPNHLFLDFGVEIFLAQKNDQPVSK